MSGLWVKSAFETNVSLDAAVRRFLNLPCCESLDQLREECTHHLPLPRRMSNGRMEADFIAQLLRIQRMQLPQLFMFGRVVLWQKAQMLA
ncbi:hypothetical protein D3C85_1503770 [compost metagenome]